MVIQASRITSTTLKCEMSGERFKVADVCDQRLKEPYNHLLELTR